ncbi:sn-glycerol-3-phosphate ABC transporter ATP-binding protein UgpC [Halorarum halophilum]|uniref:ABC-type D-xylose/L-arabinose transporter n=1 Tax=Halorarum halophilum TaxID=2743090 RepID=A0A7D5GEY6_9EURY|nr:sn-glycerol-3-phosphate ABC transporter ATP-binding protein UgpC [Halobaculum halophilum]QLG27808.1 sn-glycerol-3-phosphate ABC transporter ATP-binding protein UgpC [Halobaculum halophilum]
MSEVQFDDVRKVYDGDIVAVEGFNLDIEDGEFVTIVGPSGSGKSTLLRLLAGLEDITDGEISIGDRVVNDVPAQDRDVAMVFQNYALYPHMNVRKNMSYGLKLTSDLSKAEINERVENAAEMMGIESQLEKKPSALSGGQQQRVATGRAIVREPAVFLMDEPLSNLDAKLRAHMRTELQRLQDDLETTTVYVTHDQEEALTMSDRVVILDQGELQQVGTPDEVFNEPANLFVADFVGSPSMNFFDVRLAGNTLESEAFSYDVSGEVADRIRDRATTDDLVLGIRPEHVTFAERGDDNVISAILDVHEPVGDDNYFYLQSNDVEFRMRTMGDFAFAEGDEILVTFDESKMHIFDRNSGNNVMTDTGRTTSRTHEPTVQQT